jgi:hypothetical protein
MTPGSADAAGVRPHNLGMTSDPNHETFPGADTPSAPSVP